MTLKKAARNAVQKTPSDSKEDAMIAKCSQLPKLSDAHDNGVIVVLYWGKTKGEKQHPRGRFLMATAQYYT